MRLISYSEDSRTLHTHCTPWYKLDKNYGCIARGTTTSKDKRRTVGKDSSWKLPGQRWQDVCGVGKMIAFLKIRKSKANMDREIH